MLEERGLTPEEALSLVKTWEKEFFETPGLRVVTVLPRWIYDSVLPLRVFPVPGRVVRVGLIWRECAELEVASPQPEVEPESWRPLPLPIRKERRKLESRPLELGPPRPLEWKESGEIVTGPGKAGSGRLSADGRRLAFGVLEGSTYTVHVADLEERKVRRVFETENVKMRYPGSLILSANGGTLAFSLRRDGVQDNYLVELEGRRIAGLGERSVVSMSADGRRLLLVGGTRSNLLKVHEREEEGMRTVFTLEGHGGVNSATLSGDGRRVAFVSTAPMGEHGIFVIDLEEETILNVSRGHGSDPALSHDGSKVLFESRRDRDAEIYLADLEAGTLTNITDRAGNDRFPHIDPSGDRIIYRDWDARTFYVVDLASREKLPIPGTESVWTIHPAWRGGRVALVKWRDRTPYISVQALE